MEKITDRIGWIRDLVSAEERMEESGVVDMAIGYDNDRTLALETLSYLQQIKEEMIDASNAFNELKNSPLGRIKVYGIAKTQADFMLFRNGFKMIFSMKQPGVIGIRFNFLGPSQYMPAQTNANGTGGTQLMEENLIIAKRGAFGDLLWTHNDQPVQFSSVIKFHLTLFIRESAK